MTELKTYKITTSSRIHFIFTIIFLPLICLFLIMPIIGKLEPINRNLFVGVTSIVVGCIFFGCWKLSKITSKAKLLIQMNEIGLKIKWEKNYILYRYLNKTIQWEDVKWYKFTPDPYFDIFKIKVNHKRNFKFEHASDDKDDFKTFNAAFRRIIRERNSNSYVNQLISEAPNIYDGLSGSVLMVLGYLIIIAGIIIIPVTIIFGLKISPRSICGIAASFGSVIFTIVHVKKQQKKNKTMANNK